MQMEWKDVRREMVVDKGLEEDVADRIGEYVQPDGERTIENKELLDKLFTDQKLMAVESAKLGLEEMKLLLQYCENFGVLNKAK